MGALDYWRFPNTRKSWGGPFNGQAARRRLFTALIDKFDPQSIIETGTYRGTTTEFMATTGLPIFTIENDRRLYGFSRMRLCRRRNVRVLHGDSRAIIRKLHAGPLRDRLNETLFYYLDAHWEHDLPLAEELDMIFHQSPGAIVMIDDFQVPFDTSYRYDRYKSGLALTTNYIAPAISEHRLAVFYPSTLGSEETGSKRGCVVLALQARHGERLSHMTMLRCS